MDVIALGANQMIFLDDISNYILVSYSNTFAKNHTAFRSLENPIVD